MDPKKCIDLIVADKEFDKLLTEFNLMHDAVVYQNQYAISKLINRFGLKAEFFEELDKDSLESFLDSNVSFNRERNKKLSETKIDYENLCKDNCWKALAAIKNSNELRELITHPVITTFVNFKIQQFTRIFILNLLLFVVFFITPVWYCFQYLDPLGMWLACSYILLREIFQSIISRISLSDPQCYFESKTMKEIFWKSPANILECLLFLSTMGAAVTLHLDTLPFYKLFLVLSILFATVEFSILITAVFPSNGIYFFMLRTVLKTFLSTAFVYLLFVISFAMCFHVVFDDIKGDDDDTHASFEQINSTSIEIEKKISSYLESWTAIVRTFVRMSGEFEASSLKHQYFWLSPTFLLCFVFTSIIFYNFINGLAIDDIQVSVVLLLSMTFI
jgi:hypothetical protein